MLTEKIKILTGGLIMAFMLMLPAVSLSAQQTSITVTGTVVDEGDFPLEGVAILVKDGDSGNGTVTGTDGKYSLVAPVHSTLVFMYLGYEDFEATVDASGIVNVQMRPDSQALEESVVIGYGSARKKDLTGGVAVVDEAVLNMASTTNLMDRLVGQVAGLTITTSNAAPGSNQSLLIRGQNSLSGSNSPLIVLDGIPYDGSLADIDPNIIENMTVLKDASSVAIYGSRGSNGVILLQTKKGEVGKPKVTYKGQFGLQEPMQRIQTMGPNEYIRFKQDLHRLKNNYTGVMLDPVYGGVISASEKINYLKGETRDWQDDVFRQVFTMDHQVSISGGTEATQYMASVSYLDNPGVVYNSNYQRVNVFATITQTINKWLQIGLTAQYVNRESGGVTPNLEHAIKQSPYGIMYDETGGYYEEPMDYSNFPNPMKDVNADQKNTGRNMLVNGYININLPVKGLSVRSQFGYNYRNSFNGTYYGRNTVTGAKVNGKASISNTHNTDWTWENVIKYDNTFGKHHIDVTALYSMQQKTEISSSQSGESFVNDDSSFYMMSGAENNITMSSGYWKENMISYMARINYAFAEKYMITLTGRADGASVFGRNNKYGFFPSAAVAWQIGDEDFIRDNAEWVNMLKLRVSYGANGNNAISRYQTLDRLYATNGVKYVWGDGGSAVNAAYLASDGVGNPNLRWETTYTANVGVDFSFFGSRLGGSIDMYLSNTKDLLMSRTVPIMNGYSKMWDNVGQTRNKGIEMTLNSQNIRNKNFRWTTDLNFFLNRDEIIELRGDQLDDINNEWFIGYPLDVFYDWNVIGIWQEGDEFTFIDEEGNEVAHQNGAKPGDAKLEDVDGNGIINENDRKVIGNKKPSWTMSMGNRFEYKNLYFSFLINGVFGKWMSDNVANIGSYTFGAGNYIAGANYWTPENPDADYVSPGYTQSFEHGYYKKLNFVTLRNITLGYRLSQKTAKKIGMSGIDVNVSVNNVCAISNMRQMLNYDNTWFASYPTARSYMLGITLTF